MRDLMIKLSKLGKTLFICSHELSEVEMICDKVGIINRGKMIKSGRLLDLVLKDRAVEIDVTSVAEGTRRNLESMGCSIKEDEAGLSSIRLPSGLGTYDVLDVLKAGSAAVIEVKPKKESLEALFIRSVKEEST
jgi:ABC-2 type transport system ATP-binding protein